MPLIEIVRGGIQPGADGMRGSALVKHRTSPVQDAYAAAEAISSRGHNNLYVASSFFADKAKYDAFCAYYALMRVVDDRIDGLPARSTLPDERRNEEFTVLSAWREAARLCYMGRDIPAEVTEACARSDANLLFEAFASSLETFRPPLGLWSDFFRAMEWDLEHERFDSWAQFLEYAEGATIAPTTIYLFLIAARRNDGHTSLPESFDLLECGRQLGLFAYLGHILRDVAEDLRTGQKGLIYLTREDMAAYGVTEQMLFSDLDRGRASPATRSLVRELISRAREFLSAGRTAMTGLSAQLDKDCEFILELIVTVYIHVIDKIEACSYDPMGDAHRLTFFEKQDILRQVAERTRYSPARRQDTLLR